jgi:hypothetical protein
MPEIDLGIGCALGRHEGLTREWLYWYDAAGNCHPAPENVIEQERQLRLALEQRLEQAEQQLQQEQTMRSQAEQQLHQLLQRLKEQGIDPENLQSDQFQQVG